MEPAAAADVLLLQLYAGESVRVRTVRVSVQTQSAAGDKQNT
jgi:hypothetical protein